MQMDLNAVIFLQQRRCQKMTGFVGCLIFFDKPEISGDLFDISDSVILVRTVA